MVSLDEKYEGVKDIRPTCKNKWRLLPCKASTDVKVTKDSIVALCRLLIQRNTCQFFKVQVGVRESPTPLAPVDNKNGTIKLLLTDVGVQNHKEWT